MSEGNLLGPAAAAESAAKTPPDPAPEAEEAKQKTIYLVLREDVINVEDGAGTSAWVPHGEIASTSADTARRVAAREKPGRYVAVPLRSWQPVTYEPETKTVLKVVG